MKHWKLNTVIRRENHRIILFYANMCVIVGEIFNCIVVCTVKLAFRDDISRQFKLMADELATC